MFDLVERHPISIFRIGELKRVPDRIDDRVGSVIGRPSIPGTGANELQSAFAGQAPYLPFAALVSQSTFTFS